VPSPLLPRARAARTLFGLLAAVLALAVVPHRVCARQAEDLASDRPDVIAPLAAQVAAWVEASPPASTFATGSRRFDAEWRFGTFAMGAAGFGQRAQVEAGAARKESLARMDRALGALLAPELRAFDAAAFGEDALATLEARGRGHGHLAFLAYAGLPLALRATLAPPSRHAAAAHAIAAALAARFEAEPDGLVETYPGEVYPVDLAMAAATMALDARARGAPPPPGCVRALATLRRARDPASGLLVQALDPAAGGVVPRDRPRASGTALAAYALLYADPALSRELWAALRGEQLRTLLGFGAMLEYPEPPASPGPARGRGDIDSGPVVLGLGLSATGFSLAASRAHGDLDAFRALYATAHLFGAPYDQDGMRTYVTGGPLGDAILFAMLTAPRVHAARGDEGGGA
jgi:hypothetical protein